jgi:hypothetical protein
MKKVISDVLKRPSLYLFIFLIIFSVDRYNRWVNFEKGNFPFVDDVDQYYSYLPAAFIHHDLTFNFPNNYWTNKLENGNRIPKVTVGMAIMYSPFFFVGHVLAKNNQYKADGYSLPYKWAIHFGSILFTLLGLWFSRKNLLRFFNELITFIALICIFFGTNLFYYTYGFGEMPHSYLFFIFSVFIYFTLRWYDTKRINYLYIISFIAGFATLIRPTECLILIFPLMIGIRTISDFRERIKQLLTNKVGLTLAAILFIFPFFIQMLYWKVYVGQWFFFSYGSRERFFWADPQIFNFLFSFRKGWFLYTPMMLFAMAGVPILFKKNKELFYPIVLLLIINIYILSSWWDWPFGGSFGCRPLIHYYSFFVFVLATFIDFVFDSFKNYFVLNSVLKSIACVTFYCLILLNLKQSWQYKYGILHYNGMTKEAYLYILNKDELSPQELKELERKVRPADVEAMLRGDRDQ